MLEIFTVFNPDLFPPPFRVAYIVNTAGKIVSVLEPHGGIIYRTARVDMYARIEYGPAATPVCPVIDWEGTKETFLRTGNAVIERT